MPLHDPTRVDVLGEFGGILLTMPGHLWKADPKFFWDKHEYTDGRQVTAAYVKDIEALGGLIPKGLSAAIYTQTTDVEVEVNGVMTYERRVIKMDEQAMKAAAEKIARWFDALPNR